MNEQQSSVDADGDKSIPFTAMLKVKVALVCLIFFQIEETVS